MTTYVSRQVQLQVSEKANGEGLVLKRGDRTAKFDGLAALEEARFEKFVLSAPVTDQDLMAGTTIAAGRILYLETNSEIVVKLADTTDTGITVKPVPATVTDDKRGVLYLEGDFTHVYVTAGGTDEVTVFVGIVGA